MVGWLYRGEAALSKEKDFWAAAAAEGRRIPRGDGPRRKRRNSKRGEEEEEKLIKCL